MVVVFCLIIFMEDLVRGLPLSTSAPRGEGVKKLADFEDKQSYRGADKGGGGPKSQKFCGRPLWMVPK